MDYSRRFTSAMLLGSGGHTLFEYSAPLKLTSVKNELTGLEDDSSSITMETLYREDNTDAFEESLAEAMEYNQSMLRRKALHQELKSAVQDIRTAGDIEDETPQEDEEAPGPGS